MHNNNFIIHENDDKDSDDLNIFLSSNQENKLIDNSYENNYISCLDIENIDAITAIEVDYTLNFTIKQLKIICEYYKIKFKKLNKEKIIQEIINFESNIDNQETTHKRKLLWYYLEELKNDKFTKRFIIM